MVLKCTCTVNVNVTSIFIAHNRKASDVLCTLVKGSPQCRQREFKARGTNHRMGLGVGREVASYSRMKTA